MLSPSKDRRLLHYFYFPKSFYVIQRSFSFIISRSPPPPPHTQHGVNFWEVLYLSVLVDTHINPTFYTSSGMWRRRGNKKANMSTGFPAFGCVLRYSSCAHQIVMFKGTVSRENWVNRGLSRKDYWSKPYVRNWYDLNKNVVLSM